MARRRDVSLDLERDRQLDKGPWGIVASLNDNFGAIGYVIIAILALELGRFGRDLQDQGYDRIEVTRA